MGAGDRVTSVEALKLPKVLLYGVEVLEFATDMAEKLVKALVEVEELKEENERLLRELEAVG